MNKTATGMQADQIRIKAAEHIRAITGHAIRTLTTKPRAQLREVKEYIAYQMIARVAAGEVDKVTPEMVEAIAPGAFQSQRTKANMLVALEAVYAATDKEATEYYERRREEIRAQKSAETTVASDQLATTAMTETEIRATVDEFDMQVGTHVFLKKDAYGSTLITILTDSGQMWRKWNYESDFRFELLRELAYYGIPKAATVKPESVSGETASSLTLSIADNVDPEIAEKVRTIARRWKLNPGYRLEVTQEIICVEALIWRGDDIFYSDWSNNDNFIYNLDHAMRKAANSGAPEARTNAEPGDKYFV